MKIINPARRYEGEAHVESFNKYLEIKKEIDDDPIRADASLSNKDILLLTVLNEIHKQLIGLNHGIDKLNDIESQLRRIQEDTENLVNK